MVAADEEGKEKVPKKAMSSPVKRALLANQRRLLNRSRKSACATRIKKVVKLAGLMTASPPKTDDDIKPLELLVAEAYQEIDKAVCRGVLHKNNGARKKARVARWKRQVMFAAGMFKPSEDHPEYAKYLRFAPKAKAAEKAVPVVIAAAAVVAAVLAPVAGGVKPKTADWAPAKGTKATKKK